MKIHHPAKKITPFHKLKAKECFIYGNQVHMKIDWEDDVDGLPIGQMAVNLETGMLEEFDTNRQVCIIKIEGTVL